MGDTDAGSDDWLTAVAAGAAADAGAPLDLLGGYLPLLADAAITGTRPGPAQLAAIATYGRRAADRSVPAGRAVNLYLSAAWRLWRELPQVVRSADSEVVRTAAEAVLQVAGDAVAVFVEGYQDERRQAIRREESLRREFIDDLLRGDADVAALLERAEPFGLDLTRPHRVALATAPDAGGDLDVAANAVERAVVARFGDRDVLVATKEDVVVVLVPPAGEQDAGELATVIGAELRRAREAADWRIATGRPHAGAYGIARSYEEAREALALSYRLQWDVSAVDARDMLVYRVLGRDQAAIVDLVQAVLTPLADARGGAEPLLATLQAYYDAGGVATETARSLHLSVRAVTYRLDRVRSLTGYDPADPRQGFILHTAVLGARLLDWPAAQPA